LAVIAIMAMTRIIRQAQGPKKVAKGKGKAGKAVAKGKGKAGKAGGSWMFVPSNIARGMSKGTPKGKGRGVPKAFGGKGSKQMMVKSIAKPQSKFMEKLATIDASQKMWIGGLSEKTNWKTLQKHIEEVTGVKPSMTEILPKGKACVAFKTDDEADSARSVINDTELGGQTIQADVWTQKERKEKPAGKEGKQQNRKKNGAAVAGGALKVLKTGFAKKIASAKNNKDRSDPKMKEKLAKVEAELKVWVGGMKKETNFGQLRKWFTEAGHKPSIVNLMGKDRACVSFKTAEDASSAIAALNGNELDGCTLEVDVWTQPTDEERAARKEEQLQRREAAKAEKESAKAA